jgi:hypothetical protein
MEVGSVASSVNSATITAANSQLRQSQQAQQEQQAQPSQQTQQSPQAQPSQAVHQGEAANRARAETEASRPTVNANGQTVGVRVNTTA